MPKFEARDKKLFIDDKEVLRAWESYSGWYWFATEKVEERKAGSENGGSMIDGREVDDVIWFGLVQGFEDEWGEFSQAEIESLKPKAWEIPKINLPISGRRVEREAPGENL